MMAEGDRSLSIRGWIRLVLGVSVTGTVLVLGVYSYERLTYDPHQVEVRDGTEPSNPFLKVRIPGIDRPRMVDAAHSTLGPEERVIGFVVNGRARAYRLEALRDRTKHLVNDVVGDIPISVSYCDIDDCVRAYTGRPGQGPLGVSIAGLFEGREMILQVDQRLYFQRSGRSYSQSTGPEVLPLPLIEPTLTDWASWKRDHPDTDVYEGVK